MNAEVRSIAYILRKYGFYFKWIHYFFLVHHLSVDVINIYLYNNPYFVMSLLT
jgi:hypothetical protein